jgi:hypothetical protein
MGFPLSDGDQITKDELGEYDFISDMGNLKSYFCRTGRGGTLFMAEKRNGSWSVGNFYELEIGKTCDPLKLGEYGPEKLNKDYGPYKLIYAMTEWGFELKKSRSVGDENFRLESIYRRGLQPETITTPE